jgi:hypothetical protein
MHYPLEPLLISTYAPHFINLVILSTRKVKNPYSLFERKKHICRHILRKQRNFIVARNGGVVGNGIVLSRESRAGATTLIRREFCM